MYRTVVKRENYETRKRLKFANCASTFFTCCLFGEQCKISIELRYTRRKKISAAMREYRYERQSED